MTDEVATAHVKEITPTIFIGIGGTGREALLRIRQQMALKFGKPALPVHRFVWIDCDPTIGQELDNRPFDWLLPAAQFGDNDIVQATVDAATFQSYATNPASHKWLYKWVDPGIFSVGSISAGASQVRPRGRCAFYANFDRINGALRNAWGQVTGFPAEQQLFDEFGMKVKKDSLRVYILNSLAGGTGSGMFLDVAFLCRSIGMDLQKEGDICGYEFLPSVFAPVTDKTLKLYANAYAAMVELEFYGLPRDIGEATQKTVAEQLERVPKQKDVLGADTNTWSIRDVRKTLEELLPPGKSKHDFKEYWRQDHANPGYHRGPAFDYCYLIGNNSDSGIDLPSGASKGDILDCVAQGIFIESSGHSLATKITSSRDNIRPWLGSLTVKKYQAPDRDETIYQDVWSNLYSSMGFSFINAPDFNVRFSCAYRLGNEILRGYAMDDPSPQGDIQRQIENMLGLLHVTGPQYVQALDNHGGSPYAQTTIDPWATALSARVSSGQNEGQWAVMIQNAMQQLQRHALAPKSGPREDWGELYKMLEANAYKSDEQGGRVCKRDVLEMQLNQLVANWLEEPGGAARAIERLRELHRYLSDQILPKLEAYRDQSKASAEEALKAVNGNLGALQHEEAGKHRKAAQKLALEGIRHARDFLTHRVQYEVMEYAVALHRELLNKIMISELVNDGGKQVAVETAGLVVQLTQFREKLRGMQGYFDAELLKYDAQPSHHIFIELYQRGMYENHWASENIDLTVERQSLYSMLGISQTRGFGLMQLSAEQGVDWMQHRLEEFCRERFANATISIDAVGELAKSQDRDQKVRNFVRCAAPWVKASALAKNDAQFAQNSRAEYHFAWYKQGQGEPYRWFNQTVHAELANEPFQAYQPKDELDSETADLILMYCEKGALPLAYLDALPKYRDAYRTMLGIGPNGSEQAQYFPHSDITVATFPEICPSSDEEVRSKLKATEAFLRGLILGVIEQQKDSSGEIAQYTMRVLSPGGLTELVVPLGTSRSQVVHTLLGSEDKLRGLETAVAQARQALDRQKVIRYAALLAWMIDSQDGTFAQRYVTTPHGNSEAFNLEGSIFQREFFGIEGQVAEEHGGDRQAAKAVLDEAKAQLRSSQCEWVEPINIDGIRSFKLR